MATDQSISLLLDELVAGKTGGKYLDQNLDLILTWLANQDSQSVSRFRAEYIKRNISVDILRGYVFLILQQKLFSKSELKPYEVLGLPRTTTKDSAKARYRKLMRVFHPDKATENIENFNSYAEKINLAYRQLMKDTDKAAYVKIETASASSTLYAAANVKNDKIESPLARKVRHKFGGVKQFQLLFFAGVASFCLFVVVLLYFQSGDPQAVQSYSYKAKTPSVDAVVIEENALKADSIGVNSFQKVDKEIEIPTVDLADASANLETTIETDSLEITQASPREVSENPDQTQLEDALEVSLKKTEIDKSRDTTLENKPELAEKPILDNADDQQQFAQTAAVKAAENQPLVDLLSDGIDSSQPIAVQAVTAANDNNTKLLADAEQYQSSPSAPLGSYNKAQSNSVINQGSLRSDTTQIQSQSNVPVENNQSDSLGESGNSLAAEQVDEFSQPPVNKTPAELNREQQVMVPVNEVDVAVLKKTTVNQFDVANIFEKRFARKFLIEYLESIEKGNLAKIRSYLSNSLVIDGVAKNRTNYLKGTYALINQTLKRRYHVQFVGDVLRLDSGVFRVTVTLKHTYVFKNNMVSKNSAIKKYDIKRYSNGSEIINISSA